MGAPWPGRCGKLFAMWHTFTLYLAAHPALWTFAWPIFTAFVTFLFSDPTLDRMSKTRGLSALAKTIRLMKASGLDAREVLALLGSSLTTTTTTTLSPPYVNGAIQNTPPESSETSGASDTDSSSDKH